MLLIVTAFPHKYQTQTPNDFDDGLSTPPYKDKDLRQTADETSTDSSERIEQVKNEEDGRPKIRKFHGPRQREIDDAVEYGLKRMHDLYFIKEPRLYKMGTSYSRAFFRRFYYGHFRVLLGAQPSRLSFGFFSGRERESFELCPLRICLHSSQNQACRNVSIFVLVPLGS